MIDINNIKSKEDVEAYIKELQKLVKRLPSVREVIIPHRGKKVKIKITSYTDILRTDMRTIIKTLGRTMYEIDECECVIVADITIKVKGRRKVVLDKITFKDHEGNIVQCEVRERNGKPIISTEPFEYEGNIEGLDAKYVCVDTNILR